VFQTLGLKYLKLESEKVSETLNITLKGVEGKVVNTRN
jgi:hypothetical protein